MIASRKPRGSSSRRSGRPAAILLCQSIGRPQNALHAAGELVPVSFLGFPSLTAGSGELVILSLASVGFGPIRSKPLLALEPMQRRVETSLLQLEPPGRARQDRL